jgi:hypothetical protein
VDNVAASARNADELALHSADEATVRARYGLTRGVLIALVSNGTLSKVLLYATAVDDETSYTVEQWQDALPQALLDELLAQGVVVSAAPRSD